MALVVRTIGIARAHTKIGLANLAHNMRRLLWRVRPDDGKCDGSTLNRPAKPIDH